MEIEKLKEKLEEATSSTWSLIDDKLIDIIHYPLMPEFLSQIWNVVPSNAVIIIFKHNEMMGQVQVSIKEFGENQ